MLTERLKMRTQLDKDPDLFKSMESVAGVCTSFHSSIFLDAIHHSIPVARLFPSCRTRDMEDSVAGIHHVVEPEEMKHFLAGISEREAGNESRLLYPENDRWLRLLNSDD